MYITFKRESHLSEPEISFQIESNEYHFKNDHYHIFIDSNLPISTIAELCSKAGSDLDSLISYVQQDGILIAIQNQNFQITAVRDISGICSIYYFCDDKELVFSSNKNKIAQLKKLPLLKSSIIQWLTFDFLWDGQTFYDGLKQILIGQKLIFDKNFTLKLVEANPILFEGKENTDTELQNIKRLRSEIVNAHRIYLRQKNIVFLSGGIDSVAMLTALDDLVPKDRIENHSFKVKGTLEDETEYAESIANFLKTDLKIVERDISTEVTLNQFKGKVIRMNNPYPGIWIFANQITGGDNQIYYAGQDTRLHTPALNMVDKVAFKLFTYAVKFKLLFAFLNYLMTPVQKFLEVITRLSFFKKRFFVGLKRASYMADTRKYILRYYFKLDKNHYTSMGLPDSFYALASKNYSIALKNITTERELYNYVVSVKWTEQYVNDIRYMVDMVKDQGGRLAMPFYNMHLARFSSTIPFKLANKSIVGKGSFSDKKVSVNKFVLREALRDKINDKTYYRAKAVSSTFHIIYNQALTPILRQILITDLDHTKSVIQQLQLLKFIDRFMTREAHFEVEDGPYLLKIYELCCVIIYAEFVDYKLV